MSRRHTAFIARRAKAMTRQECAKLNVVRRVGVVLKFSFGRKIFDAGIVLRKEFPLDTIDADKVVIDNERGIRKELRAEEVVPPKRTRAIAETNAVA